ERHLPLLTGPGEPRTRLAGVCPKRDSRDQPHQVARSASMMDWAERRSEAASAVSIFLPLWAWTRLSNAAHWLAAEFVFPGPREVGTACSLLSSDCTTPGARPAVFTWSSRFCVACETVMTVSELSNVLLVRAPVGVNSACRA